MPVNTTKKNMYEEAQGRKFVLVIFNVAYEYPILGFVVPVMSVIFILSLLFGILFGIKCPSKQHSSVCFDISIAGYYL